MKTCLDRIKCMLKVSTHCTFYDIHMPFSKQKWGGSTDQRIYPNKIRKKGCLQPKFQRYTTVVLHHNHITRQRVQRWSNRNVRVAVTLSKIKFLELVSQEKKLLLLLFHFHNPIRQIPPPHGHTYPTSQQTNTVCIWWVLCSTSHLPPSHASATSPQGDILQRSMGMNLDALKHSWLSIWHFLSLLMQFHTIVLSNCWSEWNVPRNMPMYVERTVAKAR